MPSRSRKPPRNFESVKGSLSLAHDAEGWILQAGCKFQPRHCVSRPSNWIIFMKAVPGKACCFWLCVLFALSLATEASAQVSYSDSFNSPVNYLTNGVAGTIWDGAYFGAGEFANSGVGGGGPGATVQC